MRARVIFPVMFFIQKVSYKHLVKGASSEAATKGALWKEVFLEISQNSQENTCARVSFNKVAGLSPFFTEHLWTTASTSLNYKVSAWISDCPFPFSVCMYYISNKLKI